MYEAMLADARQLDCWLATEAGSAGIFVSASKQFSKAPKLSSMLAEKKNKAKVNNRFLSFNNRTVIFCSQNVTT